MDNKLGERVFFSFARYGSSTTTKRFDCCAIMIVRCVNRSPVFLMLEVSSDPAVENDIQRWEGYDQIKNFYCMPEISVDYDKLSRARLRYWDMNRHIYDENRLIQIDTHRPSDMGVERASPAQVEQSFKHWAILHGPRDVITDSFSKSKEATTKCEERTAFLKEKSVIVAKEKRINELLLLVEKLTKAQEQQKAKTSVKQPSPVILTTEEDRTTIGKKRSSSGSAIFSPTIPSTVFHQPQYSPLQVTPQGHVYNQHYPQYHHYHPSLPVVQPPVQVYNEHNVSTCAAPSIASNTYSVMHNQWEAELKRKDFEVTLKEKRLKGMELDIEAARKELAMRAIQQQTKVSQARSDLEMQAIHNDKRELIQAARSRQQFLHDQDHAIRYQQISEDRLFMKEAVRRQWHVEDRETENNARRNHNRDIIEMAARANDSTTLQSLLHAQRQLVGYQFPPNPLPHPLPFYHQAHFTPPVPLPPPPPPSSLQSSHNNTKVHYQSSTTVIPPMPTLQQRPPQQFSLPTTVIFQPDQGKSSTASAMCGFSVPAAVPPFKYHEEPPGDDNTLFPEYQSSNAQTDSEGRMSYDKMSSEQIEEFLHHAQAQLEAEFNAP